MNGYETLVATLALTMGSAWASGINLYAALLILGLGGATGNITLPHELAVLEILLLLEQLVSCIWFSFLRIRYQV